MFLDVVFVVSLNKNIYRHVREHVRYCKLFNSLFVDDFLLTSLIEFRRTRPGLILALDILAAIASMILVF